MGDPQESAPALPSFIPKLIEFPDGISYELVAPLATFRHCHDGTPAEARVVYTCRRSSQDSSDEYVMKIKIQVPRGATQSPISGPSTTTSAELKALTKFRDAKTLYAPTLVAFKSETQGADGMLPGGYINYLVMTKMPGDSLHNLYYWGMEEGEREGIVAQFLSALRAVYALGVEPVDCGLRNVLWEKDTGRCTIIDFELWRATEEGAVGDEKTELERWGLARQPAAKDWWTAWNQQWR